MNPQLVSLQKCDSYSPNEIEKALFELMVPLGGMQSFVKKGDRVLLKPNLLSPKKPQDAVCTDPAIMLAVAKMAIDAGGIVSIGDSPALVKGSKVLASLGVAEELKNMGVQIVDFVEIQKVSGTAFRSIEISKEVLAADVIINLPKLKTHGMMVLTLAVKNLYGCVVGKRKAAYHLQVRESREMFAQLLFDIASIVKPTLSILDGVIGMEGNGPGSGDPRSFNLLAASTEPWAIDLVIAEILKYQTNEVPVNAHYSKTLIENGLEYKADVVGVNPSQFDFPNFKRADSFSLSFSIPKWIRTPLKRLILPYPKVNFNKCIGCGNCADSCPASVIEMRDTKAIISLGNCIRCFCCQEVCPVKAITVKHPIFSFANR